MTFAIVARPGSNGASSLFSWFDLSDMALIPYVAVVIYAIVAKVIAIRHHPEDWPFNWVRIIVIMDVLFIGYLTVRAILNIPHAPIDIPMILSQIFPVAILMMAEALHARRVW